MKEIGIPFKLPMVQAILDGRKTQTRRVVKDLPAEPFEKTGFNGLDWFFVEGALGYRRRCPYGTAGDLLWVRERYAIGALIDGPCAGNSFVHLYDGAQKYRYGAYYDPKNHTNWNPGKLKWKPSIHMWRWASRLTLKNVGVRVERLQDISEDDAKAEGVHRFEWEYDNGEAPESTRDAYRLLWKQINGAASWDANPWVWVVSFEQVKS